MKNLSKIFLSIALAIILYFLFSSIEFKEEQGIDQSYSSIIFAISFSIALFYPFVKRYLIILGFCLLLIMLFCYMFNIMDISNRFGSLGFGILLLTVLSYLPILFRKGQNDKY